LIAKAIHIRTLGKFFSGVPQKRKSDGESKKIYELNRKRGFIDSWSKDFDGLQDSSDGQRHIQLLSSKDSLVNPCVLDYDKSTNRLLVVNERLITADYITNRSITQI
jgi:hypothetical protein